MALHSGIRAVIFDYGLTLITFARPEVAVNDAYVEIAALIEEALGVAPPPPSMLLSDVHDRVEIIAAADRRSGQLRELNYVDLYRNALADLGIAADDDLLREIFRLEQAAWWQGISLSDGAVVALRDLRQMGVHLGLCSNAVYPASSMQAQLEHLELQELFDVVTFSSVVGWRKPARPIFESALSDLGVAAFEAVMVGDSAREDIAGAHAMGMQTIRLRQNFDDAMQPETADLVLDHISDLPRVLRDFRDSRTVPDSYNWKT